jgi:hypothetical protein
LADSGPQGAVVRNVAEAGDALAAGREPAISRPRRAQVAWGILGATAAAWFGTWLLFFPQLVPGLFAWDVMPRYAQAFIGAGYVFRTAFFLNAAREGNWFRLRWIVFGNLVFTGTLLFATYWHIDQFHFNPTQTLLGHIWLVLYIFEPLTMLYLIPRGILGAVAPVSGGPLHPVFKGFLVLAAGLLLMDGLVLLINPEFAAKRWPWELNPLDARIASAWVLGWAVWTATMAFARDWDEIRRAVQLAGLTMVALLVTVVVFRDEFLPGRGTVNAYAGGLVVLLVLLAGFYVLQERRRPMVTELADPIA